MPLGLINTYQSYVRALQINHVLFLHLVLGNQPSHALECHLPHQPALSTEDVARNCILEEVY